MIQETIVVNINDLSSKVAYVADVVKAQFTGRIFRAVNVKKDGALREYRALTGVSKHVKGAGSTTAHKPELLTIYDMGLASTLGAEGIQAAGAPYRSFNMETTLMLEFVKGDKKTTYVFIDEATKSEIADTKIKAAVDASSSITNQSVAILLGALK